MEPNDFEQALTRVNISGRRKSTRNTVKADPNVQQVKLSFELGIRTLYLQNAKDDEDFTILWVRGEKKIDTSTRKSNRGQIKFGDKFMMKTNMEFNLETGEFFSKPVSSPNLTPNSTFQFSPS